MIAIAFFFFLMARFLLIPLSEHMKHSGCTPQPANLPQNNEIRNKRERERGREKKRVGEQICGTTKMNRGGGGGGPGGGGASSAQQRCVFGILPSLLSLLSHFERLGEPSLSL